MSEFSFDACFSKANQCSGKGQHEEAEKLYRKCLQRRPDEEWVLNNLGHSLVQLGRLREAISVLQRVVYDHRDNLTAHANLAAAWEQSGEKHEALAVRRRLTEIKPESADFHSDLGNILLSLGRAEEAMQSYRTALELAPRNQSVIHNYLLATNYADTLSADEVAQIHFQHGSTGEVKLRRRDSFANEPTTNRRLRVGYVSTDFLTHPVGKLMVGILAATKGAADNFCYSDSNKDDQWTAKLRQQSKSFKTIVGQTDTEFAERVRNDQIDILVDLNGHTGGQNRLNAFGLGCAPVQVSFLGYPNTTGHPSVDYYISDEHCTPEGMSDHLFSEKIWRLQTGAIATEALADIAVPTKEPFATNGYFTFGSFNNPSKVSPSTLSAWADVLNSVPDSRLQVRYAKAFRSSVLRERWLDRLCGNGVNRDRIDFMIEPLPYVQHLATFTDVDLCLDPFPYQGTMTTLESLYMGSPVLTKAGRNYCQRASSSLLLRLGEHQLVTGSVEEYTTTAIQFGLFPERLRPIRNRIRKQIRQSDICDVNTLGNELLDAFTKMWANWCTSETVASADRTVIVLGDCRPGCQDAGELAVRILATQSRGRVVGPLYAVDGIALEHQLKHIESGSHDLVLVCPRASGSDIAALSEHFDITSWMVVDFYDATESLCDALSPDQSRLELSSGEMTENPSHAARQLADFLSVPLSEDQLSRVVAGFGRSSKEA